MGSIRIAPIYSRKATRVRWTMATTAARERASDTDAGGGVNPLVKAVRGSSHNLWGALVRKEVVSYRDGTEEAGASTDAKASDAV